MNRKAAALLLALALFTGETARAQLFGPTLGRTTDLTAQDLDLIHGTLERDIHGKRADTVATWDNPASGNSGTITLLRSFTRNNKSCEEIEYRILQRTMRPQNYVFISCRQPDGTWKLES